VMNISRGRWAMQNWQVLSMVGVRSCWAIPMPYMQIYIYIYINIIHIQIYIYIYIW
jgi:hypothetical protein